MLLPHMEHNMRPPTREQFDKIREELVSSGQKKEDELTVFDGYDEAHMPIGDHNLLMELFLCDKETDAYHISEGKLNESLTESERKERDKRTGGTNHRRTSLEANYREVLNRNPTANWTDSPLLYEVIPEMKELISAEPHRISSNTTLPEMPGKRKKSKGPQKTPGTGK